MSRFFGALARGVSGARKGNNLAEQEQYDRGLQERELQSRAVQEFVRNAQWERQHAYTQKRDQMVDQRMRDLDAAEEQRRAEQKRADMLGSGKWESADDTDLGVAAETAMSVLGGGMPQARSNVQGPTAAQRVQANIDGVEYAAPERKGFAYERVGGKLLRMDRQADANAPWMKAIAEARSRVQAREDSQGQQRALQEQRAADQRALRATIEAGINSRQGTPPQPKPRPVPNAVNQAYLQNSRQLNTIDAAISEVLANPASVGLKNLAPDLLVDRLPGKGNSGGITARAGVADVGSLEIRDRSGAAVTASEFPRLRPFIPSINDKAGTVVQKLQRMREIIAEETDALREFYSQEQGFTGLPPAPTTGGRKPGQSPSQRAPRGRPSDIR